MSCVLVLVDGAQTPKSGLLSFAGIHVTISWILANAPQHRPDLKSVGSSTWPLETDASEMSLQADTISSAVSA